MTDGLQEVVIPPEAYESLNRYTSGHVAFEVTDEQRAALRERICGPDLWERIKEFNRLFDYEEGDSLWLWHTIMAEQVDEIEEHLEAGREDKALNEFIDCVLVGQQAGLLVSDRDVDELLLERMADIEERVDDVQRSYRDRHERREVADADD